MENTVSILLILIETLLYPLLGPIISIIMMYFAVKFKLKLLLVESVISIVAPFVYLLLFLPELMASANIFERNVQLALIFLSNAIWGYAPNIPEMNTKITLYSLLTDPATYLVALYIAGYLILIGVYLIRPLASHMKRELAQFF